MPGARHEPALIRPGEMLRMAFGRGWWRNPVCLAMQHDCRDGDLRLRGELRLDVRERRIARHIAVAHPIGVDHHVNEIRIVERWRTLLEQRGVERLADAPELP